MAHISRGRKKFDENKLRTARKNVLDNHFDEMRNMIDKTRNATAAEAYKDMEDFKGNKSDWKPLGTFSYDEFIFCKMQYGEEVNDPNFWKFWRKANGQQFLERV